MADNPPILRRKTQTARHPNRNPPRWDVSARSTQELGPNAGVWVEAWVGGRVDGEVGEKSIVADSRQLE